MTTERQSANEGVISAWVLSLPRFINPRAGLA